VSASFLLRFVARRAAVLGIALGAISSLAHCGETSDDAGGAAANASSPVANPGAGATAGADAGGGSPSGGDTGTSQPTPSPAPSLPLSPYCESACANADDDDSSWAVCYSCRCKQLLGALPTQAQATCDQGNDIHVYTASIVNGVPVETDEPDDVTSCDNPALLQSVPPEAACIPGGKLGQGVLDNGVIYKFVCRRKPGVPRDAPPRYFDHGIIAHNPDNGATCYWVGNVTDSDGVFPDVDLTAGDPDKIAAYTAFWETSSGRAEGDDCVGCHDNDPFMYSPHLKSVWDWSITAHRFSPYAQVRVAGPPTAVPVRRLVSPEAAACTGCHRISDQGTCDPWAEIATGNPDYDNDRPWQADYAANPDAYFPLSTWMPFPLPDGATSRDAWTAQLGASRDFILDCCSHPDHPQCKWEAAQGFTGTLP
jgi:hypothetical protein